MARTDHVLLHLHIPKTAGSTLAKAVYAEYERGPYVEGDDLHAGIYYYPGTGFFMELGDSVPPIVRDVLRRPDLTAVTGHFAFGLHRLLPQRTTYITLLRDPVDRVVSLFYHLKEWGARGPWYPDENATLEQFLRTAPLRELDNDQTRRISGMHPEFGCCTGAMLEVAQRNLDERFSVVGLTERFDDMLQRAREVLGWTCERIESWEVVNDRRPPVSEISAEARSLIVERNRLDLALYAGVAQRWARLDSRAPR